MGTIRSIGWASFIQYLGKFHADYLSAQTSISKFTQTDRPVVGKDWSNTKSGVNFTTCLAVGCGGLVLWHSYFLLLLPPLMLVRAALNVIDGMLAREHQMKSTLGGILNELADVVFDAAIFLPFGLLPGVSGYLVAILVVLSIISEMTGVLGLTVGSKRQFDGPMYKTDRGFMFSIIA